MAWTNIPSTDVDQDSPVTQTLMTALRDNAQWAWECTWHPYDMAYPGDGNDGVIYDQAVDGSVATVVSPDFADGFEYRFLVIDVAPSAGTVPLRIEWYKETDAAYDAAATVSTALTSSQGVSGLVWGNKQRVTQRNFSAYANTTCDADSVGFFAACGFADGTSQKVLRARFSFSSNNLNGGKIIMERRRDVTGDEL